MKYLGMALSGALALTATARTTRPNIVLIVCDDMGYGDLGCYGQRYINTPHIDHMASQGLRFTQAYAGSPVSAPSRATLMTGQHSGHTLVRGNKEFWTGRVAYGQNTDFARVGQMPYDTAHVILPEVMKALGYRTGMFGKWAGGYEGSPSTPDKRGVDEYYGYLCQFQAHLYYPNFLNRYNPEQGDSGVVREVMNENIRYPMYGPDYFKRTQYSADLIHRHALQWIEKQNNKQPFFGVLTYTLPHAELVQPDDSILQNYKARFQNDPSFAGQEGSRYNAVTHVHAEFAGMITRLDAYVGEILAALHKKGLDKNTLVIFTSDNGPHEEGGADPRFFGRDGKLRGLKRQCLEGGIRVPFIAYWPGTIRADESDLPFAFYDLLPTMAELGGLKNVKQRYPYAQSPAGGFDGLSIVPTLMGKPKRQQQHEYLYWEFHETNQIAVRRGDWKLFVRRGVPALYNLKNDVHEDHDVSAEHPDVVRELIDIIYKEHTDSPLFKVTLPQRL